MIEGVAMYLVFEDGIHDSDLSFLRDLFGLLDAKFDEVQQRIDECWDPDQMGLFDDAEYLVGMGFIGCQRYMASTYGPRGIAKHDALRVGPCHPGGETYARVLNSAANYWKHVDEWDLHALTPQQSETIRIIETVTPFADYTCANLLASLAVPDEPRLMNLIASLESWRNHLHAVLAGGSVDGPA